jgi:hypothetical protein
MVVGFVSGAGMRCAKPLTRRLTPSSTGSVELSNDDSTEARCAIDGSLLVEPDIWPVLSTG